MSHCSLGTAFKLKRVALMSDTPTFNHWLAAQRGVVPGSRRVWDAMEDVELRREVAQGLSWRDIALRHGRSVAAVKQRAQKVAGNA